jgi:3-oxoacyl-[acyl-carrier protein] reductase
MNNIDLKGKRAIVTGAARGIGFAIAERLLQSGATVTLWDIELPSLEKAQADLESAGNVFSVEVDVTQENSIKRGVELTYEHMGDVEILINNAGITGGNATVWDMGITEWQKVLDIDLTGVFLCCRALAPRMMRKGYGRIVNIASIAGKEGNPNAAHYSAAKAGVISLTKSLGKEMVETGVLCNCVTPAVIETPMLDQMTDQHKNYMVSKIPLNRMGKPEEVAALVAWLASEDCSFSTGSVFDISGGRATY